MKMSVALALLLIAACRDSPAPADQPQAHAGAPANEAPVQDGRIECAVAGRGFERSCTVEQREAAEGLALVVRHPDGGFRRLLLPRDGSGVRAADGAEPATVEVTADGRAEVAVGRDRYRLPAEIRPAPR